MGRIWLKNESDKRHVTAREEIQRLFSVLDWFMLILFPSQARLLTTSTKKSLPRTLCSAMVSRLILRDSVPLRVIIKPKITQTS